MTVEILILLHARILSFSCESRPFADRWGVVCPLRPSWLRTCSCYTTCCWIHGGVKVDVSSVVNTCQISMSVATLVVVDRCGTVAIIEACLSALGLCVLLCLSVSKVCQFNCLWLNLPYPRHLLKRKLEFSVISQHLSKSGIKKGALRRVVRK